MAVLLTAAIICLLIKNADAKRINVEVNGDSCKIVDIVYTGYSHYVYAEGTCNELYKLCAEDDCPIKDITDELFGAELDSTK